MNSSIARIATLLTLLSTTTLMAVAQPCDKDYDLLMAEYGLVDVTTLCDDLFVELRYSTEDNFVGRDMYGSLERAYFEPSFAQRIVAAAEELRRRNPELRLLIYDAARPLSVQRTMRRMVEGTSLERFVADGTRGGRHYNQQQMLMYNH